MGESTSTGVSAVAKNPVGAVKNAFSNPGNALQTAANPGQAIAEGVTGFGGVDLSDPFGAKGLAAEADARQDAALESLKELDDTVSDTTSSSKSDTTSKSDSTSKTTFAEKSAQEKQLFNNSIGNFNAQQNIAEQQEAGIAGLGGLQQQGRDVLGGLASGEAFGVTAEEQGRIDAQRNANIDVSSNAVNDLLNQRLSQVESEAAQRGVRGQAFSQLQTGAIGDAAKSLERSTLEANRLAADQSIALPGQRAGTQAQVGAGLANIQSSAQQQAFENRQTLQDPVALKALQDERLRGGTTVASNTGSSNTTGSGTSNTTSNAASIGGQSQAILNKGLAPGQKASTIAANTSAIGAVGSTAGALAPAFGG